MRSSQLTITTLRFNMGRPKKHGKYCISDIANDILTPGCRFLPGLKHMGEPESFFVILRWIYELFGIQANPGAQMMTIPFKAKFP